MTKQPVVVIKREMTEEELLSIEVTYFMRKIILNPFIFLANCFITAGNYINYFAHLGTEETSVDQGPYDFSKDWKTVKYIQGNDL